MKAVLLTEQYKTSYILPPVPEQNTLWQICHITGRYTFSAEGFRFTSTKPVVLLAPPRHSYSLSGTGHCSRMILEDDRVQTLLINSLYLKAPGRSPGAGSILFYPLTSELERLLEKHCLLIKKGVPELHRELLLLEYFVHLKGGMEYSRNKLTAPEDSVWSIEDVENYIRSNYDAPMSLDELAARCALNASYLSRSFKLQTGSSIFSLINRIRIEKACTLLKESSLSIIDIAFTVGYNNLSFFNRSFKKFTGKTPGDYRRRVVKCSIK